MLEQYIDLFWYEKVYGREFRNITEAVKYYLQRGEVEGEQPNPIFDPVYYRACTSINSQQSSLVHYLTEGSRLGYCPSRYFNAKWYEWQNPDVARFGCSILHYLTVGGKEYRDPSPEVDMTALSKIYSEVGDGCDLTYMLASGVISTKDNLAVTVSDADLVNRQLSFLRAIKPRLLKKQDKPLKGKNLLFVQCAENSNFWSWFDPRAHRDWDLFLNCYTDDFPTAQVAEYVCQQNGTKFTGVANIWLKYSNILDYYDFAFFIDDDLIFRFEDISLFFQAIKFYELDLAQPSLTSTSQCSWPVFFNIHKSGIRRTNGVEIMMPALSRRAMKLLLPYFLYSVSGFGLDLLMAKLAERHALRSGIVDDITVRHEKAIDQNSGTYYEYLRSKGINSKYELWRIINLFRIEKKLHAIC